METTKKEKTIDIIARDYACKAHESTNHFYDSKGAHHPYSFHLAMVADTAEKYIHLIPEQDRKTVIAGCWVHDCIEDARQSYNDVKEATNETVAELAYALTNEKGKNRKERGGKRYYDGIVATPYAIFIKLCDRIANFQYSVVTKSRMASLYAKENSDFSERLLDKSVGYKEMFELLDELCKSAQIIENNKKQTV